jgi:5'-nucleotidase
MRRVQIVAVALALAVMATFTAGARADQTAVPFTFPPSGMTDVVAGSFYEEAVNWAVDTGISVGISPTQFGPDLELPRSQGLTLIWRGFGSPTGNPDAGFTDVVAGSFYEEAVNWAKAQGITTGISPTQFGPDVPMTRAMFITLLWRAAGSPTGDPDSGFTDVPAGSFYEEAVNWAKANVITTGISPTQFGPGLTITRAEAVTLMFREPEQLQILAINDFHGNLDNSSGSFGGTGGIGELGAHMRAREADAKNSIIVSAGDLIGASPLISALFHDEPTIEAMNLLGLDINGVGNHEFDEGSLELLRMANGGTHPVDGDFGGTVFEGADFDFLAANVRVKATNETLFAPYTIRTFGGVDVAFIGMTLEGTPSIVTQAGVEGLTFHDEIETVNALVPELQAMDIEAIVVLLHEGGFSDGGDLGNECGGGLSDPLASIVDGFDRAVDLVIAGHVNDEFVCDHNGIWVTMADGTGRLFTDIDVTLSRQTYDMTIVHAENVPNLNDPSVVTPAADLQALRELYAGLAAPLANQIIGTITTDITEAESAAGESALGDVIADAQLAATEGVGVGEADVAFMNPGGIRADLLFAAGGSEADGEVTYSEAFTVQPFGNSLVTMTLTGAQIEALLEQQWGGDQPAGGRILQVSDGFTYTWDSTTAEDSGDRIAIGDIMIGGGAIGAATEYRVTVNSFLADGGDNFTILRDGTDRLGGEIDLDALVTYFGANSPVPPGPQNRISVIT